MKNSINPLHTLVLRFGLFMSVHLIIKVILVLIENIFYFFKSFPCVAAKLLKLGNK